MSQISNLENNVIIVTSTYVANDGMPILYVSNDDDEEGGCTWQFHCDNRDFDMKKMLLVKLGSILKIDSELSKLKLEKGEEARRESVSSEWIKSKQLPISEK